MKITTLFAPPDKLMQDIDVGTWFRVLRSPEEGAKYLYLKLTEDSVVCLTDIDNLDSTILLTGTDTLARKQIVPVNILEVITQDKKN